MLTKLLRWLAPRPLESVFEEAERRELGFPCHEPRVWHRVYLQPLGDIRLGIKPTEEQFIDGFEMRWQAEKFRDDHNALLAARGSEDRLVVGDFLVTGCF